MRFPRGSLPTSFLGLGLKHVDDEYEPQDVEDFVQHLFVSTAHLPHNLFGIVQALFLTVTYFYIMIVFTSMSQVMANLMYFSMFSLLFPLGICVVCGRVGMEEVSLSDGKKARMCTYMKPDGAPPSWRKLPTSKRFSLIGSGVEVLEIRTNAILLIASCVSFAPLVLVAFREEYQHLFRTDERVTFNSQMSRVEEFAGLVICLLFAAVYFYVNW
uniref:Uncharacterized protein n=1 Tax=Chromera velia CCMP2878 TaxID=1169474 RepID=A0A0G4G491_9ALVE|eukprot:Cvel_20179.t1-p1 / transcript=Cvel_20179.t1 / gene=Cvel_20179 / organism=Chromera_velia_CCMP2878 / gene_product=hypothetical protein / transcript_product=hypothetical protein / location=Cvel_scaffold1794:373-2986(+) / protein_length=213 / sequence_SO=supercontig / SO=protein_coding / is_pseudo=false